MAPGSRFPSQGRSDSSKAGHRHKLPSRNRNNGIHGGYATVVSCAQGYPGYVTPAMRKAGVSPIGEDHHTKGRLGTVDMYTHPNTIEPMDQGKQFSAMSPLVDFDAVCQKVREAVEPARIHAVSLHDNKGEVLWLTESSMGPDEHNAVREAFEAFSKVDGPPVLDYDLGDSRSAVLFRAVNSRRALVGAIMIVMDSRGIKQTAKGAARLMSSKLQTALSEFAGMRPEAAPPTASAAPTAQPRPVAARAPVPQAPPTRTPQAAAAAAPPVAARTAPASATPAPAGPAPIG